MGVRCTCHWSTDRGPEVSVVEPLSHKPLVEAIFELRWAIPNQGGLPIDPFYQMLIGQLYGHLRVQYPVWERLPAANLPESQAAFLPHHRFRREAGRWPVVQLGPGLVSVHETDGYCWETFKPQCKELVQRLFEIYSQAGQTLTIADLSLRYIDADRLAGQDPVAFLAKLKVSFGFADCLFESGRVLNQPQGISINAWHPTRSPKGALRASFSQGHKDGEEALIWECHLLSSAEDVPDHPDGIAHWLEAAHETTGEWFDGQINGELKESYR
jgi:uncharacterized protein (TIGR04255 family)